MGVNAGVMIWKDTLIEVRDVEEGPLLNEHGVRTGWTATTDDSLSSRMFYPADMFTYEPYCETCNGTGKVAVGPWGVRPPKADCPDCDGKWRRG